MYSFNQSTSKDNPRHRCKHDGIWDRCFSFHRDRLSFHRDLLIVSSLVVAIFIDNEAQNACQRDELPQFSIIRYTLVCFFQLTRQQIINAIANENAGASSIQHVRQSTCHFEHKLNNNANKIRSATFLLTFHSLDISVVCDPDQLHRLSASYFYARL